MSDKSKATLEEKTDKMRLTNQTNESPIIYIMVVGFHHKFGCQLEFVYPENKLIKKNTSVSSDNDVYTLPKKWAHLPSLALPDGSHNYNSDYIYFHLEDEDEEADVKIQETKPDGKKVVKDKPNRTLFGISCYRQINASEMINKDSNVTRNTLQKSVCILSTCPLYATSIRLKLHSITCAYFDQKDFHRTQLLVDAFNTTFKNSTAFSDYSINYKKQQDENLIGLSLSDLVHRYQHKIVILFKLILLQKKCLFQLKPVSNLSNTIISLISLIPDIFKPDVNAAGGLEFCSGFFDSIDLVNCELERKASRQSKKLLATKNLTRSTISMSSSSKKVVKKKRMLSFSSKKKGTISNGSLSSSSSPMSSVSSSPITSANQFTLKPDSNQQSLSQISTNTPRFNNTDTGLNSSSNSSNNTTATFHSEINDSDLVAKENENPLNESQASIFGRVSNVLNLSSQSDIINESNGNGMRSNKSNLNSAALTSTPTNKNGKNQKTKKKHSPSHNNGNSPTALSNDIAQTPPHSASLTESRFQLEDLLSIDFGMPFKLFSEFNILHPYLSLYYLEYFTMINKMNTKLFCTTSLMLSMMSAANTETEANGDADDKQEENGSNTSSIASTGSSTSNQYPGSNIGTRQAPPQKPTANEPIIIGYTIGATNALFKQRLYDDIDVFIDEANIDMKQNDTLKKQLQLTTADLRFADYLIKHVTANRQSQQRAMSNNNTPTLLSVKKKTNSFCETDENSINNPSLLSSSNWEGSDEWIRLNFKWYFYSLLGSMIKEDLCTETRYEAEVLINQIKALEAVQQQFSSSSSSTGSLSNDVVDIDDYIERASVKSSVRSSKKNINSNLKSSKYSSYSLNPSTESTKQSKSKSRKNSLNQSLNSLNPVNMVNSAQNYLNTTQSYHVNYIDEYNSSYLNEFKKTDCYLEWLEQNRVKLENNLFKLNEFNINESLQTIGQIDLNATQTEVSMLNTKLQSAIKKLQHLEAVKLSHPFSGTIGMHDIKLRFNFLFTTTDSGKKINKAFTEGSKIMNTTGRAVGDVFSQAKSSFSNLFSNWSNTSSSNSNTSMNKSSNKSNNQNKIDENNQKFTNL